MNVGKATVRSLLMVLGVWMCLALVPSTASAHAQLVSTSPQNGQHLDTAPSEVTLTFDEPVQVVDGGMQLFGDSGKTNVLDAESRDTKVSIALPANLDDGDWLVTWRVISADGHPISGVIQFQVGVASGTNLAANLKSTSNTAVETLNGAMQAVAYLAILLGAGWLLFQLWIGYLVPRRDGVILVIAATVAVISQLFMVPLASLRQMGRPLGDLFESPFWDFAKSNNQAMALYLVTIGWAVMLLVLGLPRDIGRYVGLSAALIMLESAPAVGHTQSVDPRWLMATSDIVHVFAATLWSGGLLALIWAVREQYLKTTSDGAVRSAQIVTQFSTAAAFIVGLLAISGVLMAWRILGAWEPLYRTTYGQILMVKVGLVCLPVALAAWNRKKLVPRIQREPTNRLAWFTLGKFIAAESMVVVAIIVLTGFLVMKSPRLSVQQLPGSVPTVDATPAASVERTPSRFDQTVALGENWAALTMTPADRGDNTVKIAFMKTNGDPLTLTEAPTLRIELKEQNIGPLEFPMEETSEPGVYEATVNIPTTGKWMFSVNARLSQFESPGASWQVPIPATGDTPEASPQPRRESGVVYEHVDN